MLQQGADQPFVVQRYDGQRVARPVAYALHPEGKPALLADPGSSVAARAAFATKHLWVTAHDPA
ncbi:hypothetical protein, partial [Streptomyces sp. Agncl-13]|uniref:copper amine oxidase n=1 Tax=Streptomyces sp. Agncl-13 TaxID=3400628 RepID=UPI003A8AABE7